MEALQVYNGTMYQGGRKASKEKIHLRNREYIRRRKEIDGDCCICGESRLPCLDYHHKDPNDKVLRIAVMVKKHSLASIDTEINKCMLVCANCHRIIHAKELLQQAKEKKETLPLYDM